MLKFATLLVSFFFLFSCQKEISQTKTDYKSGEFKPKEIENVKKASLDFSIPILADAELPRDDIEIRFYRFGNSYILPAYNGLLIAKNVLILKRTNSEWSGTVIRDVDEKQENKAKIKKRIIEQLKSPKSSWESLAQNLVSEDLLTLSYNPNDEFQDATLYVMETKISGKYHLSYSYTPNEASEIKEESEFAKFFNIVAEEFNFSDFKAPKRLLE